MKPLILLMSLAVVPSMPQRSERGDSYARTVIVVAARDYREPLQPWIERREAQGYRIEVIDPESLANDSDALCEELARRVGDQSSTIAEPQRPAPATFVLLVGDAPGQGEPADLARLIPAAMSTEKARPSRRKRFVSDNLFGLPDNHGRARLAVGRWPVRSPEEVAVQVRKVLNFEQSQSPGVHRRDVTFMATTPNYDPAFDPILERLAMAMINAQVKSHWGLRALYSSPGSEYFPGPEETQRQVIRWLEESTPMTLFAGHGYDQGVDVVRYEQREFPVLDALVAARIAGKRPGTVLWMSTCSCGDFDLPPPHRGLAEALVINPNGPTAVVAGSDETSAYANLLLCLGLAQDILEQPPVTLGEAFLRFKLAAFKPAPPLLKNLLLSLEPVEKPDYLPYDHQFLYNLLGDPTLALNLPRRVGVSAEVTDDVPAEPGNKRFTVSGELHDWDSGMAYVSLTLDRMVPKEPVPNPALLPDVTLRNPAYFERFLKANDKVAAQGQVEVRDRRFRLQLSIPERLAAKVRWLQVYVHTEPSADGTWHDGVGAQSVKLVADSP